MHMLIVLVTLCRGPTAVASSSHYYNMDREGSGSSEDSLTPPHTEGGVFSAEETDRDEWFSGDGPPLQMLGGTSSELDDVRLVVPPGCVVLCGHHTFHRATRAAAGAAWRCMFKLNMARVSEPVLVSAGGNTQSTGALLPELLRAESTAEQHRPVWTSTLAWLQGSTAPPPPLPLLEDAAMSVETADSEVEAVNAAVALGLDGGTVAVAALGRAFASADRERSRRAAMHGLGQIPMKRRRQQDGGRPCAHLLIYHSSEPMQLPPTPRTSKIPQRLWSARSHSY